MPPKKRDIIADLEKQEGSLAKAARALGVSPQRLANWKQRGLTEDANLRVWLACQYPKVFTEWRIRMLEER